MKLNDLKIICISVDSWSELWKRKQMLMLESSKHPSVSSVLYINPPRVRSFIRNKQQDPKSKNVQDKKITEKNWGKRAVHVDSDCWVYQGIKNTFPFSRFKKVYDLNLTIYYRGIKGVADQLPGNEEIIWLYDPSDWEVVKYFPERKMVCFDWTDDWSAFSQPVGVHGDQLIIREKTEQVLKNAGMVFAVSDNLYQRAKEINPNSYHLPNATDYENFNPTRAAELKPALDLEGIPEPRIGYIGQIRTDRIDTELVRTIADKRPEWSFIFVGPEVTESNSINTLGGLNNVHFLGTRPYHELAAYLTLLDVCIIPHYCDSLTMSMDPIKLYDYLASGKPVVSTPVAGTEKVRELIYTAQNAEEFIAKIEIALKEDQQELSTKRLLYAKQNSWQERGIQAVTYIQQSLDDRNRK